MLIVHQRVLVLKCFFFYKFPFSNSGFLQFSRTTAAVYQIHKCMMCIVNVNSGKTISSIAQVVTQGHVPRHTGGDINYYPGFNIVEDGEQLHYDICKTVLRPSAFGCNVKVRCCRGLEVEKMYAAFDPNSTYDQSQFQVNIVYAAMKKASNGPTTVWRLN